MMSFKIDIILALKEKGYTTRALNKGCLKITQQDKIRNNIAVFDLKTINNICRLLECQPGDILEYIPDEEFEEHNKHLQWLIDKNERASKRWKKV